MRDVKVIKRNDKYGVIDDGEESVPFVYDNEEDAISEWEYFERLNTSENKKYSYRCFLKQVTSYEDIDKIISKYKNK